MERQGMIRDSQRGLVHGKSCLMNLIALFEAVTDKTDEGSTVDVVHMDLERL